MTAYLEVGYRRFQGTRHGRLWTWAVIARSALAQNWKSKLLRWLTVLSWTPLLYFSLYFYAIGQITAAAADSESVQQGVLFSVAVGWLEGELLHVLRTDPGSLRVELWTLAFYYLSSYTQLLAVLLVPALVGPGLIADDRRKGALMLYFSRPVTVVDYVAGKLAAVSLFIAAVSLFPLVGLYLVSILTSPSIEVLEQTWPVLMRAILASLAMVVPTALLVLFLSSLTARRGYLAFLWVGFVIGSTIISRVLLFGVIGLSGWDEQHEVDYTSLCSYGANLSTLSAAALDAEEQVRRLSRYSRVARSSLRVLEWQPEWYWSAAILGTLSLFALAGSLWRARAPDRGWG